MLETTAAASNLTMSSSAGWDVWTFEPEPEMLTLSGREESTKSVGNRARGFFLRLDRLVLKFHYQSILTARLEYFFIDSVEVAVLAVADLKLHGRSC